MQNQSVVDMVQYVRVDAESFHGGYCAMCPRSVCDKVLIVQYVHWILTGAYRMEGCGAFKLCAVQ